MFYIFRGFKMKLFKVFAAIMIPLLALLLMQSCSSDNSVSSTDDNGIQDYNVYDYNFSSFDMHEASLDDDMDLDECQPMRPEFDGMRDKMPPHAKARMFLGRVFREMNLTEEQRAEIRTLMQSHILCEMQWFRKLQAARQEILTTLNAERRAIMEKVKNGDLTRRQAEPLIRQLNARAMEMIKNLPINEEAREGIILCRETFLDAVGGLLIEEQLVIWNSFLENIKR